MMHRTIIILGLVLLAQTCVSSKVDVSQALRETLGAKAKMAEKLIDSDEEFRRSPAMKHFATNLKALSQGKQVLPFQAQDASVVIQSQYCSGTQSAPTARTAISSPQTLTDGSPTNSLYEPNTDCYWKLCASNTSMSVGIQWTRLALESGFDDLYVFDLNQNDTSFAFSNRRTSVSLTSSGTAIGASPIVSTKQCIGIHFDTDGSIQGKGFTLQYQQVARFSSLPSLPITIEVAGSSSSGGSTGISTGSTTNIFGGESNASAIEAVCNNIDGLANQACAEIEDPRACGLIRDLVGCFRFVCGQEMQICLVSLENIGNAVGGTGLTDELLDPVCGPRNCFGVIIGAVVRLWRCVIDTFPAEFRDQIDQASLQETENDMIEGLGAIPAIYCAQSDSGEYCLTRFARLGREYPELESNTTLNVSSLSTNSVECAAAADLGCCLTTLDAFYNDSAVNFTAVEEQSGSADMDTIAGLRRVCQLTGVPSCRLVNETRTVVEPTLAVVMNCTAYLALNRTEQIRFRNALAGDLCTGIVGESAESCTIRSVTCNSNNNLVVGLTVPTNGTAEADAINQRIKTTIDDPTATITFSRTASVDADLAPGGGAQTSTAQGFNAAASTSNVATQAPVAVAPPEDSSSGLSGGAIAGIVIAVIVVLAVVAVVIVKRDAIFGAHGPQKTSSQMAMTNTGTPVNPGNNTVIQGRVVSPPNQYAPSQYAAQQYPPQQQPTQTGYGEGPPGPPPAYV